MLKGQLFAILVGIFNNFRILKMSPRNQLAPDFFQIFSKLCPPDIFHAIEIPHFQLDDGRQAYFKICGMKREVVDEILIPKYIGI